MTTPIRRNASSRRVSIDISLGGVEPSLPPCTVSAIQKTFVGDPAIGPDRTRPGGTDGTLPAVAIPSTLPARRRNVRQPHACNRSKSGRTGRPKEAAGKSGFYTRGARRLRGVAPQEKTLHFAQEFREGSVQDFPARIDHNGPLGIQPSDLRPYGLADAPFDPIPRDGFAQGARRGDAHARAERLGLAQTEGREQRPRTPVAMIVDSSEILKSQQTNTFWKTCDETTFPSLP